MKCQMLFSGKNISKCCLLKILPRVLSVKRSYFVERVPGRFGQFWGWVVSALVGGPFRPNFNMVGYISMG